MTRPLCIFLQLAGAFGIFWGSVQLLTERGISAALIIGIITFVAGGIGYRRFRKRKDVTLNLDDRTIERINYDQGRRKS